jgi:hypothetical protein
MFATLRALLGGRATITPEVGSNAHFVFPGGSDLYWGRVESLNGGVYGFTGVRVLDSALFRLSLRC